MKRSWSEAFDHAEGSIGEVTQNGSIGLKLLTTTLWKMVIPQCRELGLWTLTDVLRICAAFSPLQHCAAQLAEDKNAPLEVLGLACEAGSMPLVERTVRRNFIVSFPNDNCRMISVWRNAWHSGNPGFIRELIRRGFLGNPTTVIARIDALLEAIKSGSLKTVELARDVYANDLLSHGFACGTSASEDRRCTYAAASAGSVTVLENLLTRPGGLSCVFVETCTSPEDLDMHLCHNKNCICHEDDKISASIGAAAACCLHGQLDVLRYLLANFIEPTFASLSARSSTKLRATTAQVVMMAYAGFYNGNEGVIRCLSDWWRGAPCETYWLYSTLEEAIWLHIEIFMRAAIEKKELVKLVPLPEREAVLSTPEELNSRASEILQMAAPSPPLFRTLLKWLDWLPANREDLIDICWKYPKTVRAAEEMGILDDRCFAEYLAILLDYWNQFASGCGSLADSATSSAKEILWLIDMGHLSPGSICVEDRLLWEMLAEQDAERGFSRAALVQPKTRSVVSGTLHYLLSFRQFAEPALDQAMTYCVKFGLTDEELRTVAMKCLRHHNCEGCPGETIRRFLRGLARDGRLGDVDEMLRRCRDGFSGAQEVDES
jgi:hypothetical protein